MFLGQYRYSFDDKDRLMIPARFRALLADGAFVTQGFDRNLVILTPGAFQQFYQLIMALNIADPLARSLHRIVLGNASELEMDKSGRVLLPRNLREYANLTGEAALIGQGDYLEIWAPALWTQQEVDLQNAEVNSMRFASLNLARQH